MRVGEKSDIVVCAAGGLPGELHKLWRPGAPLGYHVEYGYSCMGYEIAGGIGVKMALPDREVVVTIGDGSYLMMNSEIATSVMLGMKLIIVVNDNRGFGCINRLQTRDRRRAVQQSSAATRGTTSCPTSISSPMRARWAPRRSRSPRSPSSRPRSGRRARRRSTQVIVIDTDPARLDRRRRLLVGRRGAGGLERAQRSVAARRDYEEALTIQRVGD